MLLRARRALRRLLLFAVAALVVEQQHLHRSANQDSKKWKSSNDSPTTNFNKSWAAICMVVRDEDPYIDEFVDYHLGLGFKKIYVYDSHPNHTLSNWTAGQTNEGVQLKHRILSNDVGVQEEVYSECVHELRNLTHPPKWVMFLDGDEFLVFRNGQYTRVTDFLDDYVTSGSLQISWLVFGTSNKTQYEPKPVTQRFKYRTREPDKGTKTVAVLDHIEKVTNPHYVILKRGYKRKAMDGLQKEVSFGGAHCCLPLGRRNTTIVAVHHYRYKSLEEFHYRRCVRGRIYKRDSKMEKAFCTQTTYPGEVYDDLAWETLKRNVPKYEKYSEDDNAS